MIDNVTSQGESADKIKDEDLIVIKEEVVSDESNVVRIDMVETKTGDYFSVKPPRRRRGRGVFG